MDEGIEEEEDNELLELIAAVEAQEMNKQLGQSNTELVDDFPQRYSELVIASQQDALYPGEPLRAGGQPNHILLHDGVLAILNNGDWLTPRCLIRLERTCKAMRMLVGYLGCWERKERRLLSATEARFGKFPEPVIEAWNFRAMSTTPKQRFFLLVHYVRQLEFYQLERGGLPSLLMQWARTPLRLTPAEIGFDVEQACIRKRELNERVPERIFFRIHRSSKDRNREMPESHLLLNGGVFYVPDHLLEAFRFRYVHDILAGTPLYISERRLSTTCLFPMLVDFDLYEREVIGMDTIIAYCRVLQSIIAEFYPHKSTWERRAVVCTAPFSSKLMSGVGMLVKIGIHVLWPDLIVSQKIAMLLRRGFLIRLTERFGQRPAYNCWATVMDDTIYSPNGMRMIGSRKTETCSECKGKSKPRKGNNPATKKPDAPPLPCSWCMSLGKVDVGRVYELDTIIDGDGGLGDREADRLSVQQLTDLVADDDDDAMSEDENGDEEDEDEEDLSDNEIYARVVEQQQTSISELLDDECERLRTDFGALYDACALRRPEHLDATPHEVPGWLPMQPVPEEQEGTGANAGKRKVAPNTIAIDGLTSVRPRPSSYTPTIQPLAAHLQWTVPLLERLIGNMPGGSCNSSLSKVSYDSTGDFYICASRGKWCANKGLEHTNNNVWFYVGPEHIRQKCFARKTFNPYRPGDIPCMLFSGEPVPLPEDLQKALFPSFVEARQQQQQPLPPPPPNDESSVEDEFDYKANDAESSMYLESDELKTVGSDPFEFLQSQRPARKRKTAADSTTPTKPRPVCL